MVAHKSLLSDIFFHWIRVCCFVHNEIYSAAVYKIPRTKYKIKIVHSNSIYKTKIQNENLDVWTYI